MRKLYLFALSTLILQLSVGLHAARPQEYVGRVDHIYDGQTVRVFYRGGQIRVRLPAIETPQAQKAKQTLAKLVSGKTVRITEIRWDKGYLIGNLTVDDKDVRSELVRVGHARAIPADSNGKRQVSEN